VQNVYAATSVRTSDVAELVEHQVAQVPAEARSLGYGDTTDGHLPGVGRQRPRPSGRGGHTRIPESKQLNCYQAFIIATSLWPLRWGRPRRPRGPATDRNM
jgi:hypothetical protein